MKWLARLKNTSEGTRERIVLGAAVLTIALIIIIWALSLSGRFSQAKSDAPQADKPFQALSIIFQNGMGDIQESNRKRKETLNAALGTEEEPQGVMSESATVDQAALDFGARLNADAVFVVDESPKEALDASSSGSSEEGVDEESL